MNMIETNGNRLTEAVAAGQQMLSVSESSRVQAEIQASLTVAAARPRDEIRALDRIKVACQRIRLAEAAEYSYSKGGTDISGPSVRLLECCARYWGNLSYGFRELSQGEHESTVEAFAWDMESNTKEVRVFVVPHKMKARGGMKYITDPREVYEWIANQSQRRVRACLEHVIPRDVIEEAQEECQRTVAAEVEINAESIGKLTAAFEAIGVTAEQLAKRIGRNIEAITPAQYLALRRVYNSISEGLSATKDWFPPIEEPAQDAPAKQTLKDVAQEQAAQQQAQDAPPAKKKRKRRTKAEMAEARRKKAEAEAQAEDPARPWESIIDQLGSALQHGAKDEIRDAWEQLDATKGVPPGVVKEWGSRVNAALFESKFSVEDKAELDQLAEDIDAETAKAEDSPPDDGPPEQWELDIDNLSQVLDGVYDKTVIKKAWKVVNDGDAPQDVKDQLEALVLMRIKQLEEGES